MVTFSHGHLYITPTCHAARARTEGQNLSQVLPPMVMSIRAVFANDLRGQNPLVLSPKSDYCPSPARGGLTYTPGAVHQNTLHGCHLCS